MDDFTSDQYTVVMDSYYDRNVEKPIVNSKQYESNFQFEQQNIPSKYPCDQRGPIPDAWPKQNPKMRNYTVEDRTPQRHIYNGEYNSVPFDNSQFNPYWSARIHAGAPSCLSLQGEYQNKKSSLSPDKQGCDGEPDLRKEIEGFIDMKSFDFTKSSNINNIILVLMFIILIFLCVLTKSIYKLNNKLNSVNAVV